MIRLTTLPPRETGGKGVDVTERGAGCGGGHGIGVGLDSVGIVLPGPGCLPCKRAVVIAVDLVALRACALACTPLIGGESVATRVKVCIHATGRVLSRLKRLGRNSEGGIEDCQQRQQVKKALHIWK